MLEEIDHVELYVGDARQAAYFLCMAYGFRLVAQAGPETGASDRRSLLLEQGKARLLLTSALRPEHPAAELVMRHGDGVRDIALRTRDIEAAFRRAVQGGALPLMEPTVFEGEGGTLVRATVSSPMANVVHSLIQRQTRPSCFIPGLFGPLDSAPSGSAPLFTQLDHLAMCLVPRTLDAAMRFYERAFGFHQAHEENVSAEYSGMSSKVAQNESGSICFPMQEPATNKGRGQLDDFLAAHGGPGVQHIALLTSDIVATLQTLRSRNVEFLRAPSGYYDTLAERVGPIEEKVEALRAVGVLVDRDAWGYLLQIFAKPVNARNTFFFEVIQRRQARGFGGANIKALYEALERERARG